MATAISSEMLMIYQTTRYHFPQSCGKIKYRQVSQNGDFTLFQNLFIDFKFVHSSDTCHSWLRHVAALTSNKMARLWCVRVGDMFV
jgi:hypothetical protein